jgi:hypothetical protein
VGNFSGLEEMKNKYKHTAHTEMMGIGVIVHRGNII